MSEEKRIEIAETDPFLIVTWPSGARLQMTLSFEDDFLPMFDHPGDLDVKLTEEVVRNQFSKNLFAVVSRLLVQEGEAENE